VYFNTIVRIGRFINATALNRLGSWHIVQPSVPYVGAPILIRPILFILSENNQNPLWQVLPLKPDSCASLGQLAGFFETYDQFARFVVPAVFVLWFVCCGDAENTLPDTAL
jgi:hypothetical protein